MIEIHCRRLHLIIVDIFTTYDIAYYTMLRFIGSDVIAIALGVL